MKITVLTLFPEMFEGVFGESIIKRAVESKHVTIELIDFRKYSEDKHNKVDDIPYGGGSGMVLTPQPLFDAVEDIKKNTKEQIKTILMTPQGRLFNQDIAYELSEQKEIILICGRYEGVDERVRQHLVNDEISIGDYVLTGGEIPAMVVVDAVTRLIPGVLGNENSHKEESFSNSLLEYPQYTRPRDFRGYKVPEVLFSGNHKEIEEFRKKEAEKRTLKRRPDLLN